VCEKRIGAPTITRDELEYLRVAQASRKAEKGYRLECADRAE
jgi:hypothetical protein